MIQQQQWGGGEVSLVPRCPQRLPYFWLYFLLCCIFDRGAANVSIFLLRPDDDDERPRRTPYFWLYFLLRRILSAAPPMLVFFYCNPTTMMMRRQGLPCPPSHKTHTVFLIVFFAALYFVRGATNVSISLIAIQRQRWGRGKVSLVPRCPRRTLYFWLYFCLRCIFGLCAANISNCFIATQQLRWGGGKHRLC